jgi:hypothetical protein
VVLTGMAANICVLFTANDAYMRDLLLAVPSDCVASNTDEENRYASTRCGRYGRKESRTLPLYQDNWFTFSFAEARIIPRFHLEGIEAGRPVSVFKIDPGTGERLGLLGTATVGDGGWVDLTEPIIVRAGETFVAVPAKDGGGRV